MTQNRNALLFFFCLSVTVSTCFRIFGWERVIAKDIAHDSQKDEAVIVAVYDGDTVKVRFPDGRAERVRLIGVDAPEIEHPKLQIQLWAQLSKRFSFCFLYKKKVLLAYDWQREDKYDRLLAYIWTGEGELFNEFIIASGFASAYLKFPFDDGLRERFIEAERKARTENRGLWKPEPYAAVPARQAGIFIGQAAAVKFVCRSVSSRGNFVYLASEERSFAALIPEERLSLFPDPEGYRGRDITVMGLVEEYKGQPQILLFFPEQIVKIAD
jgi:micrococcal nuclease